MIRPKGDQNQDSWVLFSLTCCMTLKRCIGHDFQSAHCHGVPLFFSPEGGKPEKRGAPGLARISEREAAGEDGWALTTTDIIVLTPDTKGPILECRAPATPAEVSGSCGCSVPGWQPGPICLKLEQPKLHLKIWACPLFLPQFPRCFWAGTRVTQALAIKCFEVLGRRLIAGSYWMTNASHYYHLI